MSSNYLIPFFCFNSIFYLVLECVLIDSPVWLGKTLRTASPATTATHSSTNPPTMPADSTNTSNVPDLEEEMIRLWQNQTEMQQKLDEAHDKLDTALGEVASLRQLVEAMREQMFPTPPHLQCPTSRPTSRVASGSESRQSSMLPEKPPALRCTDHIPITQPSLPNATSWESKIAPAAGCTNLVALV